MSNQFEVVEMCDTWGATAPWGSAAEFITQATLEAAQLLAADVAADHGPDCTIAVRYQDLSVEEVRGTATVCRDCGERSILRRMIGRGEDREEIRGRIEWARGHGLLDDDTCDELHIQNATEV